MARESRDNEAPGIGLLPHQIAFIDTVLKAGPRSRVVLADEVGTGKTIACVGLIRELTTQFTMDPRVLVLTPTPLISRWRQELHDFAGITATAVDAQQYRYLENRARANENPWENVRHGIASIDFVANADRVKQVSESVWDLVIIDEAHRCRSGTKRGRLLESLWQSAASRVVAVTATPEELAGQSLMTDSRTIWVRRTASDLRGLEGDLLFTPTDRVFKIQRVELTRPEHDFFEVLIAAATPAAANDVRMTLLLRRAASSLFSVEQSLRRILSDLKHGHTRQLSFDDLFAGIQLELDLAEDANESGRSPSLLRAEQVEAILRKFDEIEVDSKWEECKKLLTALLAAKRPRVVVFCEYRDTALYLTDLMANANWQVWSASGADSREERVQSFDHFRNDGGVLVTTTAASQIFSLSFVKTCVHYDLPWNYGQLLQRFGRIHRYGAPRGSVQHFFFIDDRLVSEKAVQRLIAAAVEKDFSADDPLFSILSRPVPAGDN